MRIMFPAEIDSQFCGSPEANGGKIAPATGRSKGGVTASCKGTAKQTPGLSFEATLVRIVDN